MFTFLLSSSLDQIFLKNEHIILSCFMAHPKHPFSPYNRTLAVLISCMISFGLEAAFSSIGILFGLETSTVFMYSMTVGAAAQATFDVSLKFLSTCPCVQTGFLSRFKCLRCCCMALGRFFFTACVCVGAMFTIIGLFVLQASQRAQEEQIDDQSDDENPLTRIPEPADLLRSLRATYFSFVFSKFTSFFFWTTAACVYSYCEYLNRAGFILARTDVRIYFTDLTH